MKVCKQVFGQTFLITGRNLLNFGNKPSVSNKTVNKLKEKIYVWVRRKDDPKTHV